MVKTTRSTFGQALGRRNLLAGSAALSLPALRRAHAAPTIKIGILSDMSGRTPKRRDRETFLRRRLRQKIS